MENKKEYYMYEAILEAKKAVDIDEVPVGAIIVKDNEIIARAHNIRETTQISTHHAEILAINEACSNLNTWRLVDCEMYVTLEPCAMCAGALILARVQKVFFGAYDQKSGSIVSVANMLDNKKYNHTVIYEGGILEEECKQLLKDFFKQLRIKKNLSFRK